MIFLLITAKLKNIWPYIWQFVQFPLNGVLYYIYIDNYNDDLRYMELYIMLN